MQKSRYAIFGFAAVVIVGCVAAYFGAIPNKGAEVVTVPVTSQATQQTNTQDAASTPVQVPDAAAPAQPEAKPDAATVPQPQETGALTVPSFDVLRLEGDGSLVIAGKAAPNALVDVIARSKVLGSAKASNNGDFAIVLDRALQPGDYQLVLRATSEDKSVATSQQTAIVSVPETKDGKVLALVEEPGKASRMITTPQAGALVPDQNAQNVINQAAQDTVPQIAPGAVAMPPLADNVAPAKALDVTANTDNDANSAPLAAGIELAVEAVEIEGKTTFVAGHARGGASVSIHANDLLLGNSKVSAEGRYLVQTQQALAVGDYIIKAELMDKTGKVLATARVPFRREAGNVAAIAPDINPQTHPELQTQPQASGQPQTQNLQAEQNGAAASDQAANAKDANQQPEPQPLQNVDGSVIIRKGDNLWTISKRTYGSGMRYTTIYLANSDQIKNPDLIWPGQVFVMPSKPLSDDQVPHQAP